MTDRPEIGKTLDLSGITTNYHDVGEGPPILLIHGSGPGVTAWANWQLNIPAFAESFRVIAPDMVGFGYSSSVGKITDKQVWVDQIAGLLDALGIERVSLVGNSFGGGIALAFMIAHPDRVDRTVLMGSAGLDIPLSPALDFTWGYEPSIQVMREVLKLLAWDHSRLTEELVESRYQASIRPGAHEPYQATFGGPDRRQGILLLASDEEDIAALPHEVLILHGKWDEVIPIDAGVRLNNLLSHSDLHIFGECGHWVQIERRVSFNKIVENFFRNGLKG